MNDTTLFVNGCVFALLHKDIEGQKRGKHTHNVNDILHYALFVNGCIFIVLLRKDIKKGFSMFQFDLGNDGNGCENGPVIAKRVSVVVTEGGTENFKVLETLVDSLVASHDCFLKSFDFTRISRIGNGDNSLPTISFISNDKFVGWDMLSEPTSEDGQIIFTATKRTIDPLNESIHAQCNLILYCCLLVFVGKPRAIKFSRFFNAKVSAINGEIENAII